MILASMSCSSSELHSAQISIVIGLLMISLLAEKFLHLPALLRPLALVPCAIVLAFIINPVMPYMLIDACRFWGLDCRLAALLVFPAIAWFGFRAILRQKEIQRSSLAFGLLGVLPMFFAIYSYVGILLQTCIATLVLHQCLRHGSAPDFQVRLVRSCTRLIFIALPLTWLLSVWEFFQGLATMTGAGKNAMLIISYVGLLNHITLELLLLLPLLLWLLRQDRLRQTQTPGESHEN